MPKTISYLLVFLLLAGCGDAAQHALQKAYVPDEYLGELFHAVQMARVLWGPACCGCSGILYNCAGEVVKSCPQLDESYTGWNRVAELTPW